MAYSREVLRHASRPDLQEELRAIQEEQRRAASGLRGVLSGALNTLGIRKRHDAGTLAAAVEKATRAPGCVGRGRCNYFVGKIAEELDITYFRGILSDTSPDGRMANEIYGFVRAAVGSEGSGWMEVTPEQAQELGNAGRFVIGVARALDPSESGHVVLVVPGALPRKNQAGGWPWVRDSENPHESVRANFRFSRLSGAADPVERNTVKPIWAVWVGK